MIWGATGGIGRALVDELLDKEWSVVAVSRDEEALTGRVSCSLRADVGDAFSVQRAVQAAAHEVDNVALWVYAAGDITAAPVEEMTPAVWERIGRQSDRCLPRGATTVCRFWPRQRIWSSSVRSASMLPGLSAAAAKAGWSVRRCAALEQRGGR
jgi:hypothetical protein